MVVAFRIIDEYYDNIERDLKGFFRYIHYHDHSYFNTGWQH